MIFFKIILPSIICTLIIVTTQISIEYYPISFGLVLGLINWKNYKFNPYLGLFFTIIISFVCFLLAYISFPLLSTILKPLLGEDLSSFISIEIAAFVIGPLLVFFSYSYIFNYPKKSIITRNIILGVIIILVFVSTLFFILPDSKITTLLKDIKLRHYTIWQIVMALGIQLIIYQKEIFFRLKSL
ncbi:hypothetical protein [Tenacibaculum larymnensis]|uniref:Uncharacterized protein n=1 Tax=Tenacibaculum larymnensis TaxID=2878201 RepID=A0A9X4EUD0_9FLAO|nr:hypothetical protein [Tenacibaculum larymnensis]MDE1208440.1 hypothetical protein [Tenacibaculum larymnensis]